MKILCTNKNSELLSNDLIEDYPASTYRIIVGQQYLVYALTQLAGFPGYFICEKYSDRYPLWYPSIFFEIVYPKLSRYWIPSIKDDRKTQKRLFLGFPEWANDDYFYDGLVDGDGYESKTFNAYRQLMDLEFSDNSIKEKAEIGDENWLICPTCIDAWESVVNLDAMVVCPKCKKTYHNPRYTSL